MDLFLSNKDESIIELKNKVNFKKGEKKRNSITNKKNRLKLNYDIPSPKRIKKSLTKKSSKNKSNLNDKKSDNMLNEYLHSHKFGIQRKKTRGITVKTQKDNINLKINKSFYNKSNHDWKSMIYYPSPKNMNKEVKNLKNDEKPNLKIIENSIMLKLNSMRNNIQNE